MWIEEAVKALAIIENAKTSRPSVCNAMEVLLVDRAIASDALGRCLVWMHGKIRWSFAPR